MIVRKRDVTKVKRGIIAHGVNCRVAMGSGVALALYSKWPKVRTQYMERAWLGPRHLGKVDLVRISQDLIVANCYTQNYYGRDGKRYASTQAIGKCLTKLAQFSFDVELPVFMPKIGCGLAGLTWEDDVYPVVSKISDDHDMDLTVCCL